MFFPKRIVYFFSLFLLLALILAPVSPARAAVVLYAAPSVMGSGDCSSWADACTLQTALSDAVNGNEIWVQAGVHYPGSNRTDTFTLKNGVAVYGGFSGTETTREDRRWRTNLTILSGDIDHNDTNTDGNNIAETWNDIQGNNAYHVVTGSGTGNTTILDGFVITAGQANSTSFPHYYGGGMYNDVASPTLTNLTFSGNFATYNGGGMYNQIASPTLTNVMFSSNYANAGGGMYNYQSSSPTLTDVEFNGNSASLYGGGMCNYSNSSPSLNRVNFYTNSAVYYGGGMYNFDASNPTLTEITFQGNSADAGGGMYNINDSDPTLTTVIFVSNSATSEGGGMYNDYSDPSLEEVTFNSNSAATGGGMYNTGYSLPQLTDVAFNGNFADYGGGMYNYSYGNPTLINVTFSGNYANAGGGMYNEEDSSPALTNVAFSYNAATTDSGGGMYNYYNSSPTLFNVIFSGNTAPSDGGGMYNDEDSSPTLANVTFSGNSASYGGGMYSYNSDPTLTNVAFNGNSASYGGGMTNEDSSPTLTNVIMWGDSAPNGPEIYNNSSTLTISYSDIQGCSGSGAGWQSACGTDGGGNIDADPLFVDADGTDNIVGTADDNLRLGFGSPAIDAGNNISVTVATDLDGLPRKADGNGDSNVVVDMGAYEAGTMLCSAPYTFNDQSGVNVTVVTPGNLTCIYVDEMELNHPNATTGIQTGRYWLIRGLQSDKTDATDFSVTLTLPTTFTPDTNDKVCRYTGSGQVWDCAMSGYTANSITRNGVSAFSDWAVGNNVGPTAIKLQDFQSSSAPYHLVWLFPAALAVAVAFIKKRPAKR
jgi:hypothetical protein